MGRCKAALQYTLQVVESDASVQGPILGFKAPSHFPPQTSQIIGTTTLGNSVLGSAFLGRVTALPS